ncbi:MAG: plasmid pRiA4b ORF-3 family protein [Bacteroidetes bacterium]|nr:plasmid pRiA4b ORF-3 family protein [Bacteroidota bacterium]
MHGIQFKIEIENSSPKIWRRIVVPYEYTFYKFHLAIQGAFGWSNQHLFEFSEKGHLDKVCYAELNEDNTGDNEFVTKDAKRSKIKLVFVKHREFKYIYDFGDMWSHKIKFEELIINEIERPYCLDGGGACPPEDCGGLGGYEQLLNSLNTPGHPEQETYIRWIGLSHKERWDANFFSVREANIRLSLID